MLGTIKYPVYPKSFKVRKKFFNNPAEEINSFIRRSVRDIILQKEIGMLKGDATHTFEMESTKVTVAYESELFNVTVEENRKTYSAPVETNIILEPINCLEELYFRMKILKGEI